LVQVRFFGQNHGLEKKKPESKHPGKTLVTDKKKKGKEGQVK